MINGSKPTKLVVAVIITGAKRSRLPRMIIAANGMLTKTCKAARQDSREPGGDRGGPGTQDILEVVSFALQADDLTIFIRRLCPNAVVNKRQFEPR